MIVGGGHHGLVAATDASARAALLKATLAELDAHPEGPVTDCLALDDRGEPCIEAKTPLDLEGD